MSKKMILTNAQIKQVAREVGRTKSTSELAKEFGVKTTNIRSIVCRLRYYGVNVPKLGGGTYEMVVRELKTESPELFSK